VQILRAAQTRSPPRNDSPVFRRADLSSAPRLGNDAAMASILILYSTVDGHTRTICERLRGWLAPAGHEVTVLDMKDRPDIDLRPFDKIVIGASIRYGKHRSYVGEFIERNAATLQGKPAAFFSVNVVARKPGKDTAETNPYARKFLGSIAWRPRLADVFAGRIDYAKYGVVDRLMIRLIMWITRGPTDPKAVVEFTDWTRVEAFARAVTRM
jgi:menaquinone-dependent protoporphyrinogen oxidase